MLLRLLLYHLLPLEISPCEVLLLTHHAPLSFFLSFIPQQLHIDPVQRGREPWWTEGGREGGFYHSLGDLARAEGHPSGPDAPLLEGFSYQEVPLPAMVSADTRAGAAATAGYLCTRSGINKKFYGREVDPADLLHGKISKPRAAKPLYDALNDLP
jgi:hypothetical protein